MMYLFKNRSIGFIWAILLLAPALQAQNSPNHLAHHTMDGFRNPWPGYEDRGFMDLLKWGVWERFTSDKPEKKDHYDFPFIYNDGAYLRENQSDFTVTWIGHSSLLVQMDGINILTDPIWSERCSPFQWIGPKRHQPPGLAFEDLPPIDLVIISHDHYDHLDKNTIKSLGNDPFYLVPLGIGQFLKDQGITRYQEMDWWDSLTFNSLEIICTPAQHFSGRKGIDRNRTLWASWVIKSEQESFYFGGDTGYFPEFVTIAERYGPFDAAALPIGAYQPRWFMSPVHMSPQEAVDAFLDLNARIFVPIHWGTFSLADEPLDNPPQVLQNTIDERELDSDRFWILKHGETRRVEESPVFAGQDLEPGLSEKFESRREDREINQKSENIVGSGNKGSSCQGRVDF